MVLWLHNGWRICGEQLTRLPKGSCFKQNIKASRARNMRLLYGRAKFGDFRFRV